MRPITFSMNEWNNQWKKHEEQETNEHSMERRTMKKLYFKWNMYDLLPSIMKFYHRKYMLTKNTKVSQPRTFSYPGSCATNTPTSLFRQCDLILTHWNNLNKRVETGFKGGLILMTSEGAAGFLRRLDQAHQDFIGSLECFDLFH